MSGHSRSPSTPLSRSTSMVGKIFNKLRTPSGSSSSTSSPPIPANAGSYSTPSLASSSKSSLDEPAFTGFQNGSRSTLGLDDELDVEFPELETSPIKATANNTPLVLGSSNPFSKTRQTPPREDDDPTLISRPSSSLSKAEEKESSGLRSIQKTLARSREILSRTNSGKSELAQLEAAADAQGQVDLPLDSFKSPPAVTSYSSLSSRHTATRPTALSATAAAASSSGSTLLADTTPALSRGLTAASTLPLKSGGTASRQKPWLERRTELQRGTVAAGATLPRPMRARRAAKAEPGLERIDMMAEAESSQQSSQEREQRTLVSRARPPTSPGMHGRSRSELAPASPKMAPPARDASTVTIDPSPASSAAPAAAINPSSYLKRAQERSSSAQGFSSSNDLAPARSASAMGSYSRSSPDAQGISSIATAKQLPPSSAAALRERFLKSTVAGSGSASSSPDAGSSSNGYSPSTASARTEPSPPSSQGSQGAYLSSSSRTVSPETRRAQQVEKAAAELADLSRARPASPGMMPYAARTAQPQPQPVHARSSPVIPQAEEVTVQTVRPGSSAAVYRDEQPAPLARQRSFDQNQPPQQQQPIAPYHDENAYSAAPPTRPPMVGRPQGRVVLAESHRSNIPQQHPQPPQPLHQQQPPPQHQYGHHQPSAYPTKGDSFAPVRDRSPGMGESGSAYQQHYYSSQQLQQQQQQQQYQQQPMYHSHQQQPQQAYYAQPEPAPQPKPKKNQSVIIVNGKMYARAGLLGKGGSSRVYRVLDANNHLFAIKRVDISKNDAESRASFINEIALLERLRGNAQIIHLVDSEINDSKKQLLMVMEVGETDLHGLLIEHSGKPISMNFIRYIWEQMLRAVKVIHDENVVHTDLKPANFVIVKGQLKLIDFGISKAIGNDTTNIGRDQQIGSANYMPPEALLDSGMGLNGKRLMKLGRAADVWSLGCILYQMVYGHTPFSHLRDVGRKIMAIQNPNHAIQFPADATVSDLHGNLLSDCTVHLGQDLLEAMRSCLVWDPKKRATIPELLEAEFLRGSEAARNGTPAARRPQVDAQMMKSIVRKVRAEVGGADVDADRLAAKLMQEFGLA